MKISDYKTKELAKLFNDGLKAGKSGVVICKEIGLARSSVLTRLKRDGYVYEKELNKYVIEKREVKEEKKEVKKQTKKSVKKKEKIEKEISPIEEVVVESLIEEKVIEEPIEKKYIDEDMGEDDEEEKVEFEVEKAISKLREALWNKPKETEKKVAVDEAITKAVKVDTKIEEMKKSEINNDEIDEIRVLLKEIEGRVSVLESNDVKKEDIITIKNTKETTTRSIRLYKEVNEKFNKYLKKHKEKKVIDILSLAILEYINKR
ncbi:MAG: hypothetical protein ACRC30_07235 [Clostridium sp.]